MDNGKTVTLPTTTDEQSVVNIDQQAGNNSIQVVAINSTVTVNNIKYELTSVSFNKSADYTEALITPSFDDQHKGDFNVYFADLWQLEKLSQEAKQVLEKYGCEAEFGQWVKKYIIEIGGEHYSLMAQSLLDSCKINKSASPSDSAKEKIKEFINKNGKEKFCVFLSAITSIEKQNTIEYYAAKYINKALDRCGIGAFWWENDDLNDEKWFVSSKIATGLALSSIFICLAYDSVQLQSNNTVNFTCFDGKLSPCFKYEYDTYKSFLTSGNAAADKEQGTDTASSPLDNFIDQFNDDKSKFPSERKLRVFSYGSPYKCIGCNAVLNNCSVQIITTNITSNNDIKNKIRLIFKSVIAEIFKIINEDESIKDLCPKIKRSYLRKKGKGLDSLLDKLWKEADRKLAIAVLGEERSYSGPEYSFLYNAFDPQKFYEGKYCDKFLGPEWGESDEGNLNWVKDGSKENIEAVPIDYFFQYAIVDESGRNAKNHFLVFPERYNDENGNFKWRIKIVIRDWNLRAVIDNQYRLYLLGKKENNLKPNFDERFPLSDYSLIEFYKGVSDLNKISSSQQEYASCQIYSGSRVAAERITTINSGVDNHCAFILYADMLNEIQPTYHMTGFLRLSNETSSKNSKCFYISLNFYPKPVVYNIRRIKTPSLHKTEARCPYCGRIKTSDNKLKGNNRKEKNKMIECSRYCYSEVLTLGGKRYRSCEYNFIGCLYALKEDGMMKKGKSIGGEEVVFGNFTDDELNNIIESLNSKKSSGRKVIEQQNSRLIYEDCYDNGIVVTMVGKSRSGKSTFVSRMLSVHSEGDYEGDISCDYLENAMKPYVQSVSLLKVKTREMVENHGNAKPDMHGINGIRLLEDYKSPKYQEFLPSTQIEYFDPVLTHIPFALELEGIQSSSEKKATVSFFDLPGGLFSETERKEQKTLPNLHDDYTMLYRSDSIILLLNDEQEDEKELRAMIEAIDNVSEEAVVAVVFCKADELFGKQQYNWDYIRNSSSVAKDNKFNGSKRQTYIDKCSDEIEYAMTKLGSETIKGIIAKLKKKFAKHHKFFAVSALGRGDSIICDKKQDKKYTLYETSPLNIENVLLWIMFEKGIIE